MVLIKHDVPAGVEYAYVDHTIAERPGRMFETGATSTSQAEHAFLLIGRHYLRQLEDQRQEKFAEAARRGVYVPEDRGMPRQGLKDVESGTKNVGHRVKMLQDSIKDLEQFSLTKIDKLPEIVLVGDHSAGKGSLLASLGEHCPPQLSIRRRDYVLESEILELDNKIRTQREKLTQAEQSSAPINKNGVQSQVSGSPFLRKFESMSPDSQAQYVLQLEAWKQEKLSLASSRAPPYDVEKDYQLQLEVLELDNKRRALQARFSPGAKRAYDKGKSADAPSPSFGVVVESDPEPFLREEYHSPQENNPTNPSIQSFNKVNGMEPPMGLSTDPYGKRPSSDEHQDDYPMVESHAFSVIGSHPGFPSSQPYHPFVSGPSNCLPSYQRALALHQEEQQNQFERNQQQTKAYQDMYRYQVERQQQPMSNHAELPQWFAKPVHVSQSEAASPTAGATDNQNLDRGEQTRADYRVHLGYLEAEKKKEDMEARFKQDVQQSKASAEKAAAHKLQDYQMQLMLLEQQNKKRHVCSARSRML